MNVETRTVPTPDGRELCLEIAGDSARTILVHSGSPNSRHLYPPWIEDAAARGARLISYDRPGYGGSTPQPDRTVADAAGDGRTIAQAVGIERLLVWGLSGGGPPAIACAALLPDLVAATGVVASPAPWGVPDLDYFEGMGEENVNDIKLYLEDPEAARRKGKADREELLEATPEQIVEAWRSLLSDVDAAVVRHDFGEWIARCMHDGLAPGDQGWWDDGVSEFAPWGFELDSIGMPIKLWHGRHDQFVPFQHGRWLAEHIPGIETELSDRDGHLTLLANRIPEVHEWLLAHW